MKTNLLGKYYIGLGRDEYRKDLDLYTNSIDEIKARLTELSGTELMTLYRLDEFEDEGSFELVSSDCSVVVYEMGA